MAWSEVNAGQVSEIYEDIMLSNRRITMRQLDEFNAERQFRMDVAMWYGFLEKMPDQRAKRWKHGAVCRMFSLLLEGGLMVRRNDGWIPWEAVGGPVASVISHTARVVVALPKVSHKAFWRWLWNDAKPQGRASATHGVERNRQPQNIYPGVRKAVKENKTKSPCRHYGINIALGGEFNVNPVSGNIIYPNGEHGHLYLSLSKKKFEGRTIMLLATEQSASVDRHSMKGRHGSKPRLGGLAKFGAFMSHGLGVPDQYGGKHSLGGHNDRACNGGQDWTDKYLKGRTQRLADYGPGPDGNHYIDGMYIDLTEHRFGVVRRSNFTKGMLGMTPKRPVRPPR
jgi:hypothetical protein